VSRIQARLLRRAHVRTHVLAATSTHRAWRCSDCTALHCTRVRGRRRHRHATHSYTEAYDTTSGAETSWAMRRDLKAGRSQGHLFLTADGTLVMRWGGSRHTRGGGGGGVVSDFSDTGASGGGGDREGVSDTTAASTAAAWRQPVVVLPLPARH
jgi:hypothetical protein